MDERDAKRLQAVLIGPDWEEVMAPRIKQQLAHATHALVVGSGPKEVEDRLRGWIQALRWVLEAPWRELEEWDQRTKVAAEEAREMEITEKILSDGFRAAPIDEDT